MKNTPFKMKGFSGFGNSPLRATDPPSNSPEVSSGGLMRNERGGGPRPNNKKRRRNKFWGKLGRGTLKVIDKILPGGNESIWKGNVKIACGPRGCD